MWTDGGILYTDRPRQQAPNPMNRTEHKMAEWKVDWWLGREVKGATGRTYFVSGADVNAAGDSILHLTPTDALVPTRPLRLPLVHANEALRKGTWELL